jgi:hypothetical protein
MKDTRNRWAGEAVALLLPILIVSSPFLFGSRSLDGREFRAFFRGRAAYAQELSSRDGEWPRWNSRQYAGTPFLGDLHGSLHYPPNLLYLAMTPERAFGLLFVFHMIVAAIGMYRLCRYFEFRRSAGVLGGVAYGVSFSVAAHMAAGTLSHFVTPALAPWVLLLILRMVKRGSMLRIVMLGIIIGAVLLGGNPQDFPFLLLLGAGLIRWTAVDAGRRNRPWKKSSMALISVSAVLGIALASASILPALEVGRFAAPASAAAEVAGDWRVLYIGVLPTLLSVLPFQSPRRGPALYFAIAAVAAVLPALLLPRLPVCSFWVVTLSLSGLAATGWDGLARGRYQPRTLGRILAVAGGLAVVGAGLVFWRFRIVGDSAILLGLLGASALVLIKFRSHPRAVVAALLITAGDLCFFDARAVRTLSSEEYAAPPWYAAHIGPERDEYRLLDLTTRDAAPIAHGFRLMNGYGYPRPGRPEIDPANAADLNVRWLVSSAAPPDEAWKEIARHDGQVLYGNLHSKRSAFVGPGDVIRPELKIQRTGSSIEVGGRSYEPEVLVVSESWMPGWKAYMQRREVPVRRGHDALILIDIPAGDWYVTLRYEPDAYRTGRIISSSAVAALIGLLIAGMRRSKIAIS